MYIVIRCKNKNILLNHKNIEMPKFKVADKERVLLTTIYEIEADSPEDAIDKYVNELAGSSSLIELDQYWNYDDLCRDEIIIKED